MYVNSTYITHAMQVVHLPLSPEVEKRFNVTAAINFFNSVEGLPYGFHNQFTGM